MKDAEDDGDALLPCEDSDAEAAYVTAGTLAEAATAFFGGDFTTHPEDPT